MKSLEDRIADRIGAIPAWGGGVMDLCPSTLRRKLSPEMLREIARVAADEAQAVARDKVET